MACLFRPPPFPGHRRTAQTRTIRLSRGRLWGAALDAVSWTHRQRGLAGCSLPTCEKGPDSSKCYRFQSIVPPVRQGCSPLRRSKVFRVYKGPAARRRPEPVLQETVAANSGLPALQQALFHMKSSNYGQASSPFFFASSKISGIFSKIFP